MRWPRFLRWGAEDVEALASAALFLEQCSTAPSAERLNRPGGNVSRYGDIITTGSDPTPERRTRGGSD